MSDTSSAAAAPSTGASAATPGSSMSGRTFSQPAGPTVGLQGYDLARRVLSLDARTARLRVAAGTKRRPLRGDRRTALAPPGQPMRKDEDPMDQLNKMLETLRSSVVGIVNSDAGNRAELVEKSFGEFNSAIEPVLQKFAEEAAVAGAEELVKAAPEGIFEEPLFKGLGCVGRVADLVAMLARQVATIKDGKDKWQGDDAEADPASEEVSELLDHAVAMGELALRAAVNEHVDIAMEGDEADDSLNFVKCANAEDPTNEAAQLVLKTHLPQELAKFACDPGMLDMEIVQRGTTLLLEGGVEEGHLAKVFELEGETLAKGADDMLPPDGGTDPNAQPDDGSGAADPNDPLAQLEIAGRIMAAGMMQIEHCMQLLEGSAGAPSDEGVDPNAMQQPDDGSGAAPDAGAGDPPPADGAGAGDPPPPADGKKDGGDAPPADGGSKDGGDDKKKAPPFAKSADGTEGAERLAKMEEEMAALRKQRDELAKHGGEALAVIERLSKVAAPPKGVVMQPALSKVEDTGARSAGGDDVLAKLAGDYRRAPTQEQKQQVLFKASFKGIRAEEVLAKVG